MTAAYRLKGLGWFMAGVIVTLAFYLVSLQVAAERKRLEHVNGDIAATSRDIRALETEFDTRANLAQLERWNGDTLSLAAPQAAQFVRDRRALARLDARGPLVPGAEMKTAALVVPSLPVPVTPAAVSVPLPVAPAAEVAAAAVQTPAPIRAALAKVKMEPQAERASIRPAVVLRAKPEVAMLDRHLLSASTLGELMSAAKAEGAPRR